MLIHEQSGEVCLACTAAISQSASTLADSKSALQHRLWSDDPAHQYYGCPCCAPIIGLLNDAMQVSSEMLSDAAHWQSRRPPLAAVSARVQLLVNAKIFTVDASFSMADTMAIKDGKILATGQHDALVSAYADAEIIDCHGKALLPGFIEPHMHFLPIATIGKFTDVGPFKCDTIADVLATLSTLAEPAGEAEWIMARQVDPSLQAGAEQLTRHLLDQVSTTNPVYVYNASLHFAYCNSKALEVAGITNDTPDEPGSSFGRDADGSANGVLQGGRVMSLVVKHNPAQQTYDLAEACLEVCMRANAHGITTFCDQGTGFGRGVQELDIYQALADSGRMSTRLRYSLIYALQEQWDQRGVQFGDGDEMVRASGWKIVSDGSNQGFSGLQRVPYLGSDDCGVAYVEPEALIAMVKDRAKRGWPIVIHANGDKAIDNTLDAFEAAFDEGLLTNGPCRIEHCSILHDEHITRIAKLGLSPSFLIGHVYYWGQAMRDHIFGEAKASLLDRTAACESRGIRWTLHSDEPVTEMDPLRCIENAVTRKLWREPDYVLAPAECVEVTTAIRAMTRDAAWQCHSDHEIGSLEPGKFADFVILDKDPTAVPVDEIHAIKVIETWMGGRKVYSASESLASESSSSSRIR